MKNMPSTVGVNSEDITEWIEKNEVNELTDNDIVEMVTQGEATEEIETDDIKNNFIPHSKGFKTTETLLHYNCHQDEATPANRGNSK